MITLAQDGPTQRHGTARAFLRLNGEPYALQRIRRNHWSVTRPDGTCTYHVQRHPGGDWSCTCPDHLHRHTRCKHLGALMAVGLLPKCRRKAVADA
jgi:hypothetical protein